MQWRPHFHELFHRMQLCVNTIIENSLGQSESSDADSTGNADRFLNLKYPQPRVSFYFRDTLQILRAVGCNIADGCARLKCLARCCNFGVGWGKKCTPGIGRHISFTGRCASLCKHIVFDTSGPAVLIRLQIRCQCGVGSL